jgi:inhibitor of the pro-sigma K processing machinery
MEWTTVLIILGAIIGLYFIKMVVFKPIKLIFKLFIWFVIGVFLIILVNFVLGSFGIHIPLNPLTIFIAGILQIPGIILILLMNIMLA